MRFRSFLSYLFAILFGCFVGSILTIALASAGISLTADRIGANADTIHVWRSPQGKIVAVYLVQTDGPRASAEAGRAITEMMVAVEACLEMPGDEMQRSAFQGLRGIFQGAIMQAMFQDYLEHRFGPLPPSKLRPDGLLEKPPVSGMY
ncbi:MAG TPA: hypothetical protein VJ553_07280 [Candidatus Paceibacterota bacterium]|nr:hypothetical protein [Candidatus Paceibacterota bacterium]